jgi:hypothetical protein
MRRKVKILLAGVGMNFLLAWAIFSFIFYLGTKPLSILPENAVNIKADSYLMPTLAFLQEQLFTSGKIIATAPEISLVAR